VFNNVTVPLTQLGMGAGADAFRALFDDARPAGRRDAAARTSSTNSGPRARPGRGAGRLGAVCRRQRRDWANDTCVRVPSSLESADRRRRVPVRKTRAAAWARLKEAAKKKYLAAQQSALGALASDATKLFASAVIAQDGQRRAARASRACGSI
jgi:hypothetical protein